MLLNLTKLPLIVNCLLLTIPHFVRSQGCARKSENWGIRLASRPIDESESRIAVLTSQRIELRFARVQILALHSRLRAVLHAHILWLLGC